MLEDFCMVSGQKVNPQKSKLSVSGNTSDAFTASISNKFGVSLTEELGVYLGMPIIHGCSLGKTFEFLLSEVGKKLGGWKRKLSRRRPKVFLYNLSRCPSPIMQCKSINCQQEPLRN